MKVNSLLELIMVIWQIWCLIQQIVFSIYWLMLTEKISLRLFQSFWLWRKLWMMQATHNQPKLYNSFGIKLCNRTVIWFIQWMLYIRSSPTWLIGTSSSNETKKKCKVLKWLKSKNKAMNSNKNGLKVICMKIKPFREMICGWEDKLNRLISLTLVKYSLNYASITLRTNISSIVLMKSIPISNLNSVSEDTVMIALLFCQTNLITMINLMWTKIKRS